MGAMAKSPRLAAQHPAESPSLEGWRYFIHLSPGLFLLDIFQDGTFQRRLDGAAADHAGFPGAFATAAAGGLPAGVPADGAGVFPAFPAAGGGKKARKGPAADAALGLRSRNGGLPLVPQRSENFGAHDTDLPAILGCFRSERI